MNIVLTTLVAQPGKGPAQGGIPMGQAGSMAELVRLVMESSPVVKGVIVLLFLFIFICAFIIFYKYIQIKRAQNQTNRFLEVFWESKRLDEIYRPQMT